MTAISEMAGGVSALRPGCFPFEAPIRAEQVLA
jgi:hypothetical protein